MQRMFILFLLIAVAAGSYYYFTSNNAKVGEETPEVKATLIDGSPFKLSDLKGKTVYLVFWGSWCAPCRAELPHWVEYYKNKKDNNIEVVSIALEKKEGASNRISGAMGFPWKYQIEEVSGFVATNEFSRKYGVTDIPAAFKINPDGTLAGKVMHLPSAN